MSDSSLVVCLRSLWMSSVYSFTHATRSETHYPACSSSHVGLTALSNIWFQLPPLLALRCAAVLTSMLDRKSMANANPCTAAI
jgi:hypothetical protein